MDTLPPLVSPDPGYLRSKAAYHHLIQTLGASLPPPTPDTPQTRYQRDQAAIAQVAALCPANAAEAALAAQFVAANEQAMECLRLTHAPETPGNLAPKCNAQAASMMRQAQAAMRILLRTQSTRRKVNPESEAWVEYTAGEMMSDHLTQPEPTPIPAPSLQPEPAGPATIETTAIQEAETYVHLYPKRAALIRRAGAMPADAGFAPPDDTIVQAIVTGTSPTLTALDRRAAWVTVSKSDPKSRETIH
jgi:hypothetical protein